MLLSTGILLLFSLQCSHVAADYKLLLTINEFNNPSNTDAMGLCCNDREVMSDCTSPCNVGVSVCIRPSESVLPLEKDHCPIFLIEGVIETSKTYVIPGHLMPGGIQILFFVEEDQEDRNLVELFRVEYTGSAAQPNEITSAMGVVHTGLNDTNTTMNLSLAIQCEVGFYGPSCDCRNTDDSTGHFTCNTEGERVCLEGYQNPDSNCTECSTREGCSDIGGFCEQPGECICRDGYSGDNCTVAQFFNTLEELDPQTTILVLEPLTVTTAVDPVSLLLPFSSEPTQLPTATTRLTVLSSLIFTFTPVLASNVQSSMSTQPPVPFIAPSSSLSPPILTISIPPTPFIIPTTPSLFPEPFSSNVQSSISTQPSVFFIAPSSSSSPPILTISIPPIPSIIPTTPSLFPEPFSSSVQSSISTQPPVPFIAPSSSLSPPILTISIPPTPFIIPTTPSLFPEPFSSNVQSSISTQPSVSFIAPSSSSSPPILTISIPPTPFIIPTTPSLFPEPFSSSVQSSISTQPSVSFIAPSSSSSPPILTISIPPIPSIIPTTPSLFPEPFSSNVQSSISTQPPVSLSSSSSPPILTITPTPSIIPTTPSLFLELFSSPLLSSSSLQSTQGPPVTTSPPPTLQSTAVSSLFSSPTLLSSPAPSPSTSSLALLPSENIPTSIPSISQPLTSTVNQQPRPTSTTEQPPPTSTTQQPPPTSATQQPLPTSTTEQPPPTSATQQPLSTTTTQQPPPTSATEQPPPTSATQQPPPTSTTTSTEPPTTTSPPPPPPAGNTSGNTAAIAGTAAVIIAVIAVVLITVLCVYFAMKRKKRNDDKQRSATFLDQVYNAPVTFVNPEHEGFSPRSPQLFTQGEAQQSGSPPDATYKPTFPGVEYREHEPYAETGPRSDHSSAESSQVYQLQDADSTVIANPHSWAQSSSSPLPPPATAEQKKSIRKSGLGFQYKDDPIGDAYLTAQYKEEPLSTSAQSSRQNGSKRDQSLTNGHTGSPHLPVPSHSPPRAPHRTASSLDGGSRAGSSRSERELQGASATGSSHEVETGSLPTEEEKEEDEVHQRAKEYLQAAQEESEKRKSFMKDILFTDINLDMTTQTEL